MKHLIKKINDYTGKLYAGADLNDEHLQARFLTKLQREKPAGKRFELMLKKIIKEQVKAHSKYMAKLNAAASSSRIITDISVFVLWKRSRVWGYNPKAEITVDFNDNSREKYTGRASCYGYDKKSAATAEAFNQSPELMKMLYEKCNKPQPNKELLPYGSGYGPLPYFEGGVGFQCHEEILNVLGFSSMKVADGSTVDVWHFSNVKEKNQQK